MSFRLINDISALLLIKINGGGGAFPPYLRLNLYLKEQFSYFIPLSIPMSEQSFVMGFFLCCRVGLSGKINLPGYGFDMA